MNGLLLLAAQNTLAALLLTLVVWGVSRWRNHPPLAHLLWLVVLLKLVAPPLVPIDRSWIAALWPPTATSTAPGTTHAPASLAVHGLPADDVGSVPLEQVPEAPANTVAHRAWLPGPATLWRWAQPGLLVIWLGGAAAWAVVVVWRVYRFGRGLRAALEAPDDVRHLTAEIAGRLGLRRVPVVRLLSSAEVPFLWWAGGQATIVLPPRLVSDFDAQRLRLILAHELAHLRRHDPWVRFVELAVSTIYWWNPLVIVIRRRLHEAEDLCCDAWVNVAFPGSARCYADALLEAAEAIGRPELEVRLLPASPFLRSLSLKARIAMILESRVAPHAAKKSLLGIAVLAVVVLPSFVLTTKSNAEPGDRVPKPARQEVPAGEAVRGSEFPYAVKFEQGATRFEQGDEIQIVEVRGTAETFVPGHLYWIRGTYKLGSRDQASLSAYTTARESKDAVSTPLRVQSQVVERGEGTFTLFLPMLCEGWPHVSFYPRQRGSGFGGNYFGTGDSVLKKWWDEKDDGDATKPAAQAASAGLAEAGAALASGVGMKVEPMLPERQTFEQLGQFRGGLEVSAIAPQSAADSAGVRTGDIVVGWGKYETDSLANLAYAITHSNSRGVRLLLRREGTTYATQLEAPRER